MILLSLTAGVPGAGASLVIGAIVLVVVAVLVWAVAFRKPEDETRHRKHHWRRTRSGKARDGESSSKGWFSSKRRKRRRKDRPLNPTLAETGGLPPKRADDAEAPPP
ncbi:MAG TPA: hypothetical protein VEH04_18870 [Verrucomicrobiae bacterium]|nr:hypothetical protein [Verrucomicrobiae bacterium]